jgi:hypothetical protein
MRNSRSRVGAIVATVLFGGSQAALSGCATLRGQDAVSLVFVTSRWPHASK